MWENGASVVTVAAPGSNNSSKVTSYMRGPGVVPQRDKTHIPSFIHGNLMPLGCLDDCKARLCCALSGRRPVTGRRGAKQENPKRRSFIPSDPHLPRRSLPFCPLFKFLQSVWDRAIENARQRHAQTQLHARLQTHQEKFLQSGAWISNDPWLSASIGASTSVFTVVPLFPLITGCWEATCCWAGLHVCLPVSS